MTDMTYNDDEPFLARFIEPARAAADQPEMAAAAERLRGRLPETSAPRTRRWLPQFATLAVLITGLSMTLPMILPNGGGNAFAQVQQWFSAYVTVDVRTTILQGENTFVEVRARATADGDARIDQQGLTQIINASAGTFTTLLPQQRYMQMPIEGATTTNEALDWLDKLAEFRGEAVALDEMRIVDGRQAIGHRLVIDAIDLTLWSSAIDDQPLLLEGALPGGLQLRTTFAFNVDLAPWLFELPPGFSPVESD